MKYTVIREYTEYHSVEVEAENEREALRICKEMDPDSFETMEQSVYKFTIV